MVDFYAAVETKCIAWECSKRCGYHLNSDTLVVEFIRDGKPAKPGEPGHIVVTPLYLYAMPLIRYDLGDVGIPMGKQCPCGRGLPLMEMIQGRADDLITLPSGKIVPPIGTFAPLFENEPRIVEYLIVQEEYDLIITTIVVREGNGSDEVKRIKCGVEDLVGHEATVKVEIVDRIDRSTAAKIRRIISKVPVSF